MTLLIMENVSLKNYNTLRINSTAKLMILPYQPSQLREIFVKFREKKIIIIGNGSNILLSREYYGDDFLFLNMKLMDDIFFENNKIFAQSGITLSRLVWYAVEKNVKGFEFLEDIPGTVGGAVIMNAGTHEETIGNLIEKVIYYEINKSQIFQKEVKKQDFGKRTSIWRDKKNIILGCYFNINYGNCFESIKKILELKKERYKKQPRSYPNAGSVFKSPIKNENEISAWSLIDKVGLRGFKKNDAMISEKHPNFIVNLGNAKYDDFIFLINLCKERVFKEFNVNLELEWKII